MYQEPCLNLYEITHPAHALLSNIPPLCPPANNGLVMSPAAVLLQNLPGGHAGQMTPVAMNRLLPWSQGLPAAQNALLLSHGQ